MGEGTGDGLASGGGWPLVPAGTLIRHIWWQLAFIKPCAAIFIGVAAMVVILMVRAGVCPCLIYFNDK